MSEHREITLADLAKMAASGHSVFSPSGSKMWLTCSGSLVPNILAHDDCSEEAAEGTAAHTVGETWLKHGKKAAYQMIGEIHHIDGWDIEITEEMLSYVGDYVDWVRELELDAVEFLTETRVNFSDLTPIPDQGGTADSIVILPLGKKTFEIVVTDLKYGKGIRVIAEGNSQGLLYAYGAWRRFKDRYDIRKITVRIAHPRLSEGFTEHSYPVEELLEFAAYVKERAFAAWKFDAPRTPSDEGCQWCKVKGTCPAAYIELAEVTSEAFDDDDEFVPRSRTSSEMAAANEMLEDELGDEPFRPRNPQQLSTVALGKILRYRKLAEQFFSAVEAELLERAISREEDIPGWKIVEGRANRKWPENIATAYRKLRSYGLTDANLFKTEFISPAQAEEKLKKKTGLTKDASATIVNALAIKPPGGKSLVRTSDKRPALASDADAFEDDDEFIPRKR